MNNFCKLKTLIDNSKGLVKHEYGVIDKDISSIEYDSRNVGPGSLFVAISGFTTDGHGYVKEAVKKGAAAVLVSEEKAGEFTDMEESGITLVSSGNTRKSLSRLSAVFFDYPCSQIPVIGITGTNGKTSITYMLESILRHHGYTPGVVGTINYRWKDNNIQSANTTPESKDLQEIFFRMKNDGVDVIVIEVSSHALKLFRTDDIEPNIAIFTNLTRDHLDFHDTFEDYFDSKLRIFELLEESGKEEKYAIINIDDEYGKSIMAKSKDYSYSFRSFGIVEGADFFPQQNSIVTTLSGVKYIIERPDRGMEIDLNVPGRFHVYNSLCSYAAARSLGIPAEMIAQGLSSLSTIPGRFDRVPSRLGFNVIVDYAHTDDALINLLKSARELLPARIITVFGCGGNRDKTKRPLMGQAATENSDWVIVTSDNPRNEKPLDIINDIVSGLAGENFEVEPDREEAIKKAVYMANEDDMVVIAGKGHEDYQLIDGKRIDFDDREIAGKFIDERELH